MKQISALPSITFDEVSEGFTIIGFDFKVVDTSSASFIEVKEKIEARSHDTLRGDYALGNGIIFLTTNLAIHTSDTTYTKNMAIKDLALTVRNNCAQCAGKADRNFEVFLTDVQLGCAP